MARNVENQTERRDLLSKAEQHYKVALELDSNDHICQYYVAMFYAETRRPDEAMKAAETALNLNPEHLISIFFYLKMGVSRFPVAVRIKLRHVEC